MKRISCPWCGSRDSHEFTFGGDAQRVRPDPAACSDAQWAEYLFMLENPKGPHHGRWCHTYGCGQWFYVMRDTATHEIGGVVVPAKAGTRLPAGASITELDSRRRGNDEHGS